MCVAFFFVCFFCNKLELRWLYLASYLAQPFDIAIVFPHKDACVTERGGGEGGGE